MSTCARHASHGLRSHDRIRLEHALVTPFIGSPILSLKATLEFINNGKRDKKLIQRNYNSSNVLLYQQFRKKSAH